MRKRKQNEKESNSIIDGFDGAINISSILYIAHYDWRIVDYVCDGCGYYGFSKCVLVL
jgi:hypothetical protein